VRRGLYWVGVLLGVLLLVGGVAVGALGFAETSGPAGIVRGYFAALARSDAPEALAYGKVPFGPHTLLTSTVLHEQQQIAPLRHFSVVATHRHGSTATVDVKYVLAFPGEDVPVSVSVPLHRQDGDWRLDFAAIPTELHAPFGRQRESILGAGLPVGTTLMFPGALPIRLDTPYHKLDPFQDNISFDAPSSTNVYLQVTDAGHAAMLRAVRSELRRCVTGPADPVCPLPNERYVPGSIHASIYRALSTTSVGLEGNEPVGTLTYDGKVTVTGDYRRLNFHNRQVSGHANLVLNLHAYAYATPPLDLHWALP
jgi:hypothetical protein